MPRSIEQKLQAIADYFASGSIQNFQRAMGSNDNYFVTTDKGDFLFKIIVNTTLEDIENGLPFLQRAKRHWLDNDYLPRAIEKAQQKFGASKIPETLKEFHAVQHFRPANFPQSIVHGDLDPTNCLFDGEKLVAFLDWQEVGVSAAVLDFGSTVLGFCFHEETEPIYRGTFDPDLYKALYEGYTSIRPFTRHEQEHIEVAVKYMGLTQPVRSMLMWDQYHPDEELMETTRLYWAFGLDRLNL